MRSPALRRARVLAASVTLGAATLAVAAPPSGATSVVYRDGDDVHVRSLDGTRHRQVTSDGTDATYYTLPSADDAGNVVAVRGSGTSRVIAWLPVDGGPPTLNVMPWKVGGAVNAGPTWARVNGSGSSLAYGYLYNQDIWTALKPQLAIVNPRAPGSPTSPTVNIAGYTEGSWFGTKVLATNGTQLFVETTPGAFGGWLVAGEQSITGGELSRDGSRVLVRFGSGVLELDGLDGKTPPAAAPVSGCRITPNGVDRFSGLPRMALSADGRRVAWSDAGGVHVATVASTETPEAACRLTDHVILSATGGMPSFSEYTLPAPGGGGGNPGEPGGGGGGGGNPGGENPGGENPGGENPGGENPGGENPGGEQPAGDPGGGTQNGAGGPDGGGTVVPDATGGGGTTTTLPDHTSADPRPTLTLQTLPRLRTGRLRKGQAIVVSTARRGKVTASVTRAGTKMVGGSATAKTAGAVRLTLRLTAAGRRARALAGRRVTLKVTFTPPSGRPATIVRTVTLGR